MVIVRLVSPGESRVLRVWWLDSQLSAVDVPSRDRSPGINRGEWCNQPYLESLIVLSLRYKKQKEVLRE
jgi:hypothetical protein